jgi:hypothetical protein
MFPVTWHLKNRPAGGRCYDHNFLRFMTIFGEKVGVFLKNQCYDHIFLRFLTIFGEKIGVFLKNQCYDHNFGDFWQFSAKKVGVFLKNQCYDQNFAYFSFVLSQKRQFFRWIFRRKYLKNHNIVPTGGRARDFVWARQATGRFARSRVLRNFGQRKHQRSSKSTYNSC